MPNYIKQHHAASCGPIAIINVGKWINNSLSAKHDFKQITKEIKCDIYEKGTTDTALNKFLKNKFKNKIKIFKIYAPTIRETREHLINGGSVLISFSFHENSLKGSKPHQKGEHVALFTAYKDNKWIGHNATTKLSTSKHSDEEIYTYFYEGPYPPTVW